MWRNGGEKKINYCPVVRNREGETASSTKQKPLWKHHKKTEIKIIAIGV